MNPNDAVTIIGGPWEGHTGVVVDHPVLWRLTPQVPVLLDTEQVVIVMESMVEMQDA